MMTDALKERDMWSFNKDGDARWTWRRQSAQGVVLMQSLHYFDNMDECHLDAQRHGYSADEPAAREPVAYQPVVHQPVADEPHAASQSVYLAHHLAYRDRLLNGRPD